ncbi:MAG: SDR family NAD(P)-dependent oxidoreductase [Gammaproteobacteria bacterium]|nr:SDR family NAD(P)-dependent oxidoreductase [Gammaproteobacteria bacterium]
MNFTDKTVIVTGGGSGMGAATAELFAQEGARVAIVDRDEAAAAGTAKKCNAPDCLIGDVSDSGFCDHVIADVAGRTGRVDVLVNAAGVIARRDTLSTSDEDWQRVMRVNVDGVFYMSRAALRVMKEQRSGAIVNFGSIWGGSGAPGVIAYCASKGAVHQITRAMALECVRDGVRINAVCPGEVDTPMLRSERSGPVTAEMLEDIAGTVPLGRLAEPGEIARVVLFLASEDASYMTGALVDVDAGYSAR